MYRGGVRRTLGAVVLLTLVAGLSVTLAPPAAAGACDPGLTQLTGRLTSSQSGVGLPGRVDLFDESAPLYGFDTEPNGTFFNCLDPGTYRFRFSAIGHRTEWFNNRTTGATANLVPAGGDPIVANANLRPRDGLIMGRVTNLNGVPKFASVTHHRATPFGWIGIDNGGTLEGWYAVSGLPNGRYRIRADVDHHKSRWASSAARLSLARTFVISPTNRSYVNAHIRVPYCPGPTDDFCIPPGFFT